MKRGIMKRTLSLSAIALVLVFCATKCSAENRTAAAFRQLTNLAGHWQGTDERGRTVKSTFELIAGNTAVMETLYPPAMEPMVTLYSVDGHAISLLHYCPTNNQPHMRAIPPAGQIKQLVFEFQGAGNLPDLSVGHEYRLAMEFQDENHIVERWTWRENGKDTVMVYHLHRK
jgi:hypothetical protein